MIKLKVLYDNMDELTTLINILGDSVKNMRLSPKQTGEHKRAYVDIIDLSGVTVERVGQSQSHN